MSTIGELARQHTELSKEQTTHLVNLISEWGMLADLCFADLMLHVPVEGDNWLVVAQVRAATGQTLYIVDKVGSMAEGAESPLLAEAYRTGTIVEDEIFVEGIDEDCRLMAIPVMHEGKTIAVLTREWSRRTGRQPGELERTYLDMFDRFAAMVVRGTFPFVGRVADSSVAPRVGDGAIVLDADSRVRYASPNATSALHRVGISANAVGQTLAELGVIDSSVRQAFERQQPVVEEFEQTTDVTLLTRCIPIVDTTADGTEVTGALMLLRDVTELRRRDRLILSKDATIREIHHRVKNNLQTISSLLRLQGRRLESAEAKAAVSESVRRIRTIALVHETLSREPGDDVAFVEIVRPLLRLVEERLLQNAVDHGYTSGDGGGSVVVRLNVNEGVLAIHVIDDGRGIPADFQLADATGLGLSIVRTLVTTELAGTIEMRPATAQELKEVELTPQAGNTGTVIALRVPLENE